MIRRRRLKVVTLSFMASTSAIASAQLSGHEESAGMQHVPAEPHVRKGAVFESLHEGATDKAGGSTSNWYGWQTLITDGAALGIALLATDASSNSQTTLAVLAGGGSYLLGAPIIHAAHGRLGVGVGSLGLRVGAPIAGAMVGATLEGCGAFAGEEDPDSCDRPMLVGFGLGVAAAIAVDASLLARESSPPVASEVARTRRRRIVPALAVMGDRRELLIRGFF
jgi:hypothetical protein